MSGLFVAWRDLRHARGRFALMSLVVLLITVLVGLLSGLTQGLGRESTSAITGLHTERLVFAGDKASFASSRIPVGALGGTPIGIATIPSTGSETAPVAAFGVDSSTVAPDSAGVAPGRVVLSQPAADDLGLAIGDSLRMGGSALSVAAIRGSASYSHLPVVWLGLTDWQQVTGAGPAATVVARDEAAEPAGFISLTRQESLSAIGSYQSENGSLQLIRGFLFAISALVIGAFFTVWTIQRSRDVAVLKALGAATGYLLRDALGQAAVLLLGGTAVGGLLVLGIGRLAAGRVPFALDPVTLGGPLLALNLLGLLGAALAVRRVTSIDPLTALGSAR